MRWQRWRKTFTGLHPHRAAGLQTPVCTLSHAAFQMVELGSSSTATTALFHRGWLACHLPTCCPMLWWSLLYRGRAGRQRPPGGQTGTPPHNRYAVVSCPRWHLTCRGLLPQPAQAGWQRLSGHRFGPPAAPAYSTWAGCHQLPALLHSLCEVEQAGSMNQAACLGMQAPRQSHSTAVS